MIKPLNIYNPCMSCNIKGHSYSFDDEICQKCEYNIAIKTLKKVLKENDYCQHCNHKKYFGGGYYDCKLNNDYGSYLNCKDFEINWESVFKEYDIDLF